MNQPAQAVSAFDAGWARGGGEPEGLPLLVRRRQVEGSMWPVAVVMVDEDAQHPLELAAVEDQEPIEALRSDGADEAFGDRVRLRRLHRCADDLDSLLRKTVSKSRLNLLSRSRIRSEP